MEEGGSSGFGSAKYVSYTFLPTVFTFNLQRDFTVRYVSLPLYETDDYKELD